MSGLRRCSARRPDEWEWTLKDFRNAAFDEKIVHRLCGSTSLLHTMQQGETVWSWHLVDLWVERERGANEIEMAQHTGAVDIESRIFAEEILGDFAASRMRGRLNGRFEISATPVPTRVNEERQFFDELAHFFQTAVRDPHDRLHLFARNGRWFGRRFADTRGRRNRFLRRTE